MKKISTFILFILLFINHPLFSQCISGDCTNGYGEFKYDNGKYEGYFQNGKNYGQGTYTWGNGDNYVGHWVDDDRTGQGTYTWGNGDNYVGNWKDDKRYGQGTETWANGDKYVGNWVDDKRTGQGTYTWADDEGNYEGEFKNNCEDGFGCSVWGSENSTVTTAKSGDKYIGEFKCVSEDKHITSFFGWGVLYRANGDIESGIWKDGYTLSYSKPEKEVLDILNTLYNKNFQPVKVSDKGITIEWQTPNPYSIDASTLKIKAKINCNSKPTVTYYTDTKSISITSQSFTAEGSNTYYFEDEIKLITGKNIIRILAKAGDKSVLSEELVINNGVIQPEKRLALVIGNADYCCGNGFKGVPYQNIMNDADYMAKTLKSLGFDSVIVVKNKNRIEMLNAISKFGNLLDEYDVGLVYYSGHGMQISDENYMIPIDADFSNINCDEMQAKNKCIAFNDVLTYMLKSDRCNTNIIIADACRTNPFEQQYCPKKNPVQWDWYEQKSKKPGILFEFATSPEKTANAGMKGLENSLFTYYLLKHIKEKNISVLDLFSNVNKEVSDETKQVPWFSCVSVDFYFNK